MICKNCGTESREDFCPHCGEMLRSGSIRPVDQAVEQPPVQMPVEEIPPHRTMKWSIGSMLLPAMALLLPLAYLFFEGFTVLSEALFVVREDGNTLLQLFIRQLSENSSAAFSYTELRESLMGQGAAIYTAYTPLSLLQSLFTEGVTPLHLPALVQTVMILACISLSLLLVISGGRLLRYRAVAATTVFFGMGAATSPLLGQALLHLMYFVTLGGESADAMMQRICLTPEAVLIMGISLCAILPTLKRLCAISAEARGEKVMVYAPFRLLARAPFAVTKLAYVGCVLLSVLLLVAFLFLPLTTHDVGYRMLTEDWRANLIALAGVVFGADSISGLAAYLMRTANLWWLLAVIGVALSLLFSALRAALLRQDRLLQKPARARRLTDAVERLRTAVIAPYLSFIAMRVLLGGTMLYSTPVLGHFDLSNVPATLELLYLLVGYLASFGSTSAVYVMLAFAGAVLWMLTEQTANAVALAVSKAAPPPTDT